MPTNGPSIRDQVWRAVDPTGENRALINAAIHGSRDVPDFLRRIGVDVGESWEHLAVLSVEYRRSIEGIAAAVRVLGPRGWAVMTMDTLGTLAPVESSWSSRSPLLLQGHSSGQLDPPASQVCPGSRRDTWNTGHGRDGRPGRPVPRRA